VSESDDEETFAAKNKTEKPKVVEVAKGKKIATKKNTRASTKKKQTSETIEDPDDVLGIGTMTQ